MAHANSVAKEKAVKSLIDDVFKEFKASGDFDRLRKEYFVEITSMNSFQNLTKNIDEFIQKLLDEQLRIQHHPNALKKNDLREYVRRRLNDNYSFNHQIGSCVNQIIDGRVDGNLKPIISSMVEKLTKTNEGGNTAELSGSEPMDHTLSSESHLNTSKTNASIQLTLPQRKVSIEDFLCISESSKSATTTQSSSGSSSQTKTTKSTTDKPKLGDFDRQKSFGSKSNETKEINESGTPKKEKPPIQEEKKPVQIKTEPNAKESSKPTITSTNKPTANIGVNKKPLQHSISTASTGSTTAATSSYEFMRKLSFVNEAKLQLDTTKRFNFDWKLDQVPDENILDAISVSSVDISDLSSDNEDTKPDDNNDDDEKRDAAATATAADDIEQPKIDDYGVGDNNPNNNNNKNDDNNDKDGDYSTP